MDLANAPDLTRPTGAAGSVPDRLDGLCLLSAAEATDAAFQRAWQDLAEGACEPNPYFEPWFVTPSLCAFGSEAAVTIAALYSGGVLAGVLPMARTRDYYDYPVPHLSNWMHDNSFCGAPLVLPGHEKLFWRALIEQLETQLGTSLFLHLARLPVEGPLFAALEAVIAEQGRTHAVVNTQSRAALISDLSPEQYLEASMTKKRRKELGRLYKRLSEQGELMVERRDDSDGLSEWIEDFMALEAAGWKGEGGTALANSGDTTRFFEGALTGAAQNGKLERLALRLDGRPVAMLANFLCPPGAYSFKTAFDEDYAKFSPGLLLQLENLELLERDGIEWSDSCAAEGHPMIERLWRERRTFASLNIALGGALRRAVFRGLTAYETRSRSTS